MWNFCVSSEKHFFSFDEGYCWLTFGRGPSHMTGISTMRSIPDHMILSVSCKPSGVGCSKVLVQVWFLGSDAYCYLAASLMPSGVRVHDFELFRVERRLYDFTVSTHGRRFSFMFTDPFSKGSFNLADII